MMKKSIKKGLSMAGALLLTASLALPAVGCGKKVDNSENTLEIFVVPAGYGTQWLTDLIKAFKEQDWVKEKYPKLNIPKPGGNTISDYIPSQITSGGKVNTVDLFFSCQSIANKYVTGGKYFEDLYTDVYNSTVPGEGETKVKDKMNAQIYQEEAFTHKGETKYYAMPWINGMMGIMYNEARIKKYLGEDYVMPRTTDELLQCTEDLKAAKDFPDKDRPWVFSDGSRYFNAPFVVWWSQYEGKQQYLNYWNGWDDDESFTNANFSQTGRLRALEMYQDLIGKRPTYKDENGKEQKGNYHGDSQTETAFALQRSFVTGKTGVFMAIGDWLLTETSATEAQKQDIRMLKMPVISSIAETLTFWAEEDGVVYKDLTADQKKGYDSKLSCIVQCVDDGMTYEQAKAAFATKGYGELNSKDFKKINEARNMMYRMTGHEAFIPSYATGKAIAKDFLRFMATDIGIKTFMNATKGSLTPYNYQADAATLATYYPMQQDHYAYMKTVVSLPPESVFKLHYSGGVGQMTKWPSLEQAFAAQKAGDRKSAWQVYQQDIEEWTTSKFETALKKAGLLG